MTVGTTPAVRRWHAPLAIVAGALERDVLLEAEGDRFRAVTPGIADPPADAERLRGLTMPGLANAHSHAFHRALRGRTETGRGTFWTWREQMYALAATLTPAICLALARATYAEMALAGMTCVGEFHYLHHDPEGRPYADANVMGRALLQAAEEAGIRITLLDTCYLAGGFGVPPEGAQRRFSDGDADRWAARVDDLGAPAHARIGAALHSVRAVPAEQMGTVVAWAARRACPLHVHLSEQRVENEECEREHGRSPTRLLGDRGVLAARTTAVHATHVDPADVEALGSAGVTACLCPTTERDLADGIGPGRPLAAAGCPLALGSDGHFVIDGFEEARALELDERLRTEQRGHWTAAELFDAASGAGHRALGWGDAGRLAPGQLADLVTVRLDGPRLAGAGPAFALEAVLFGATAGDVDRVVVGGRDVVRAGRHLLLDDVGAALEQAVAAAWEETR
ncbi:MAG: formimidoylglutamate deiminase [Candidatus Dormiibacterota bacterium]